MRCLMNIIRNTMLVVGIFLIYGGISTHDFYSLELHEPVPAGTWEGIWVGLILLIPTIIYVLVRVYKERDDVDVQD